VKLSDYIVTEETLSVAIYGDRGATAQRDYTHYTKRFEEQAKKRKRGKAAKESLKP